MTARRSYRYYEFVMAAFVTVLVCSNLIGPAKIAQLELPVLGPVTFGAGVLFFPFLTSSATFSPKFMATPRHGA